MFFPPQVSGNASTAIPLFIASDMGLHASTLSPQPVHSVFRIYLLLTRDSLLFPSIWI